MDLPARVALLLLGSGAAALLCELVWMRRLSLAFGSTGLALALTLSIYMAGLGLGGALAGRRPWARAPSPPAGPTGWPPATRSSAPVSRTAPAGRRSWWRSR